MIFALPAVARRLATVLETLGGEGLRLFFPLAALHAALWPFLWTAVFGLDLPFAAELPIGLWHASEMIYGGFGAAVIGFVTTAVPEWTETERLRGRALFAFAGLWGLARFAGLLGADGLLPLAALGDVAWTGALAVYVVVIAWRRRTTRLLGMVFWLTALATVTVWLRLEILVSDFEAAGRVLRIAGLVLLGLLGLVLSRITVPVTNLVLDPSEATSPFRPHPGRLRLAPGLVAVALAAEVAALSPAVSAYLLIAAGAAFLDRVAEAFVGRESLRAEILALAGASLFAGAGLMLVGGARLGAAVAESTAWHLAFMGGLGLGVLAVLAIAGLRHTGRPFGLALPVRLALVSAAAATLARVLPELGVMPALPGPSYVLPALLWAAAFLLWLKCYWRYLTESRLSIQAA